MPKEDGWLRCSSSFRLVQYPKLREIKSGRKKRLLAVAFCRAVWKLIDDPRSCRAVEVAELNADGSATKQELADAGRNARLASGGILLADKRGMALHAAMHAAGAYPTNAMHYSHHCAFHALCYSSKHGSAEETDAHVKLMGLMRDIFGNPFRPAVLDPSWLRWRDGFIPQLAQSIYDERRFGDLPILGDALEDAGCTNMDILDHCHRPGEHVRGCWVIDLLLGKK